MPRLDAKLRNRRSRRFSLTLAASAVLLPALALAALQYTTLVSLQQETRDAVRESLRQTMLAYEDAVKERLFGVTAGAVEKISKLDIRPDQRESSLAGLREVFEKFPIVDQISVARFCECGDRFAIVLTRDDESVTAGAGPLNWPLRSLRYRVRKPRRGPDGMSFAHLERSNEDDEGFPPGLYVFGNAEPHVITVRIPRRALVKLVNETIRRSDRRPARVGAPEFSLVRTGTSALVGDASRRRRLRSDPEIVQRFSEPLEEWALAAVYSERSIAESARDTFLYNLAMLAVVLAALVLGVALSLRAFARQTKLAEMKSSFVSNVSHEMRTPLALISLYSETLALERIADPRKVREYQDVIHRESKRLARMVNNVLDFSRIDSGRVDYRPERCHVEDIINGVLADYHDPIVAAGFELEVEIASDLPPVRVDRAAVTQAVLNLIDNAMKYSPDEKSIKVRAFARADETLIEIEDRGIGIAASERARVFDKFHRVGDPLTASTRGSGLGLSIARHSIEAHGGRIEVDSEPGRGSRFTIVLPVAPSRRPHSSEAA